MAIRISGAKCNVADLMMILLVLQDVAAAAKALQDSKGKNRGTQTDQQSQGNGKQPANNQQGQESSSGQIDGPGQGSSSGTQNNQQGQGNNQGTQTDEQSQGNSKGTQTDVSGEKPSTKSLSIIADMTAAVQATMGALYKTNMQG